jgi:hypothetical protein
LSRLPGLFARWPLLRHTLAAALPGGLDAVNPAVSAMAASVWASFFAVGVVALAAGLIALFIRPFWMRAALALLIAALLATNVATPGAFFRDAAFRLLMVAVVWLGVTRIVRFNLMGYFLMSSMIVLVPAAVELLQQPNSYFHANGYALVAFAFSLLLWPLIERRRRSAPTWTPSAES